MFIKSIIDYVFKLEIFKYLLIKIMDEKYNVYIVEWYVYYGSELLFCY